MLYVHIFKQQLAKDTHRPSYGCFLSCTRAVETGCAENQLIFNPILHVDQLHCCNLYFYNFICIVLIFLSVFHPCHAPRLVVYSACSAIHYSMPQSGIIFNIS